MIKQKIVCMRARKDFSFRVLHETDSMWNTKLRPDRMCDSPLRSAAKNLPPTYLVDGNDFFEFKFLHDTIYISRTCLFSELI